MIMKRKTFNFLALGIVIVLVSVTTIQVINFKSFFRNTSGIKLNTENRVLKFNSPSSFLGDGHDFEIYTYDDNEMNAILKKIENQKKWSKYPLDDTTYRLTELWSSLIKSDTEAQALLKESNYKEFIPDIENGYYFLIDRGSDDNDKSILKRGSLNFNLYLLDLNTNTIYYITLDT